MFDVLTYPAPKLREVAKPVTDFDDVLRNHVEAMFDTMYHDHGCGLAATQVGLFSRVFVMDTSRDRSNPICVINPEILSLEGKVVSEEGCLSFPGVYAKVNRSKVITVRFQDLSGSFQELTLEGLASHCVQHETDHLNGKLFIDYLSPMKRERLLKKMSKIQRL